MTTAARKPVELTNHIEFVAAHAARIQSVHDVHANELAEVDRARTRAVVAHEAALKAVEADYQTARVERATHVAQRVLLGLRVVVRGFSIGRDVNRAAIVGRETRKLEAITLRDLGRPLVDELAIAFALEVIDANPGAMPRFANPEAWNPLLGGGLTFMANRALEAIRDEHNLPRQLSTLLELEAAVSKVGTSGQLYDAESAPEVWALRVACLPGDVAEARKQEIIKAIKARRTAAHVAEEDLRYRVFMNDPGARDAWARRGESLSDLLKGAAGFLHRVTGRAPLEQDVRHVQAGLGRP
jgi:hypothetical protein